MQGSGGWRALALALLMTVLATGIAQARPRAAAPPLTVDVLSDRADEISGGDALVEIDLPAGTDPSSVTVTAGGRDITSAFAMRPNGRY